MSQQFEAIALPATFLVAITQDNRLDFDIPVPVAIGSVLGQARCRIRGIVIVSEENFAWEVWLWSNAARLGANYGVDSWLARWSFLTTDGVTSTSTPADGRFRYVMRDFDVPYRDDDQSNNRGVLHCSLIPRGASHGNTKNILLKIYCEPEIAWAG